MTGNDGKRGSTSIKKRWKDSGIMLIRTGRLEDNKRRFIFDEIFGMTLKATVQRSKIYKNDIKENVRVRFQRQLKERLNEYAGEYSRPVEEEQHVGNIQEFAGQISAACEECLDNGRFRIGSAQKALNLYLKYFWTMDRIPMPPHCPLDSIVINRLPPAARVNWTKLDDIEKYKELIAVAKTVAGDVPLALWELQIYNEARLGG